MTSREPTVVWRNGVAFQFPVEVLGRCKLHPNQTVPVTVKQFVAHSDILLEEMGLEEQGDPSDATSATSSA